MYIMLPEDEDATYSELSGLLSQGELARLVKENKVQCFVSEMKMNMLVSIDCACDVYQLLTSTKCSFGIPNIRLYYIKMPIRVDDVEGKKYFNFIADLGFINSKDAVDKNT